MREDSRVSPHIYVGKFFPSQIKFSSLSMQSCCGKLAVVCILSRVPPTRGFLQRVKFKMVLADSRERRAKWQQLEDFGLLVEGGRRDGSLITFIPIYDLSAEELDRATGRGPCHR